MPRPIKRPSLFARLVKKLCDQGKFTVLELADITGCSERHLYNWFNGDANLYDFQVEDLSRYITGNKVREAAAAFCSPEWVLIRRVLGTANGSTQDDFVKGVKVLTGIDDAHGEMERDEMRSMLDDLRQVLADLEAEYELLPE